MPVLFAGSRRWVCSMRVQGAVADMHKEKGFVDICERHREIEQATAWAVDRAD